MTERWCQAVRELYEVQQNSATDRRENFTQNSIANAITYSSFRDDVPNKYDKQHFLYPASDGSQQSGSPRRAALTSQSPVATFADTIHNTQSTFHPAEETTEPYPTTYPPAMEISPEQLRKEEERAVLEAMAMSASLPVSPYRGPTSYLGWMNPPYDVSEDDWFATFGTQVPLGYSGALNSSEGARGLQMENFPSLNEIISSMEGGGLDGNGFGGFLDDLNLFDVPL